jgi:hypothetical protein
MTDPDNPLAKPGCLVQGRADGDWYLGTLAWFNEDSKQWTVAFAVRPTPVAESTSLAR